MGRKKRAIWDAKEVKDLRKGHIDSVKRKYTHPWYPDEYNVAIPKRTNVSQDVRDYARKKKVNIVRLRY